MIPILEMNIFSPYEWPIMTVACVMKVYRHFTKNSVPVQSLGGVKFRKYNSGAPTLSSKMCCGITDVSKGLRGVIQVIFCTAHLISN
jgi:hypothetical protein